MRTRQRTLIPTTMHPTSTLVYNVWDGDGNLRPGSPSESNISDRPVASSEQTTEDVVTPDFKKRIAAGEIINNPYSSIVDSHVYPKPESYSRTGGKLTPTSDNMSWVGTYAPTMDVLPPHLWFDDFPERIDWYTDIHNQAVQMAHANVNQDEMLALATLAESHKTVDFFLSTGRRLFSIVKAAKKLDLKRLRNEISAKELAERYMELRYAVRPLIYDVNGVISALDKVSKPYDRHTARGFKSGTLSKADTTGEYNTHWGIATTFDRKATLKYDVRAGVLCHVDINDLQIFGVDQLMVTGWELLPFSFIVDWFVDVGTVVAALSPKAGVTQLASWATGHYVLESSSRAASHRGTLTSYGEQSISWPISWSRKYSETTRLVDPQISYWPVSDMNLDLYKILDLGIILRGLTSSSLRI